MFEKIIEEVIWDWNGCSPYIDEEMVKNLAKTISDKIGCEVVAEGEYEYDYNRMGRHLIGGVDVGDLLFDKYRDKNPKLVLIKEVKRDG